MIIWNSVFYSPVFTDSDITDVPISIYSQKKQLDLLSNYSRTLVHVIEHITALNKWVALASPCGVLLEAPYFSPPKSSRFHEKEHYLNSYITATRLVAEKMNVPYIDIRTPSLQAIPIYRVGYKGEHNYNKLYLKFTYCRIYVHRRT